ncbi:hypothetical protein NDU88_004650 [Pleurodeles waltl]|uniref:Uncharacterized protein n=1 Tax=Pleurodeles waltl TaxID=8319 RepID=A0AAV7SJI8_PLEWA|nr:hypothetical protein NDU88_004650 [Pleurodeles waltl]
MAVVEVSASEWCVLLDVVMLIVDVDVVHASVSVDVNGREVVEGLVCLADQCIFHVNAKYPGLVHDAFVLRNSSIPNVMAQLQRHREEETGNAPVAAVDPEDSENEEAKDEDVDNRTSVIRQYFH